MGRGVPPVRSRLVAGLALAVVTIAGCVLPDQLSQLQKDVADVRQQLARLAREQAEAKERLAGLEAKAGGGEAVTRAEFADARAKLEDVSGQVLAFQDRLDEANRRMDRLSQDVQTSRELSRKAVASLPSPGGAEGPGGTQVAGGGRDALPDPSALYNSAYADFSKGSYALAISGFEEYQTRFPGSDLADNALYWIGECYFSQGRYADAIRAFDRMLERYPESDRAPAADLKKALALLEQNQVGPAIVQLRYVVATYAGTDEARVAKDRLASLGSAGR